MAYRDLQEFMDRLESIGELVRIKEPVSPELEITEITSRDCKDHGPALLFENIPGYSMPVLTNAFGSLKRMSLALDTSNLDNLGEKVLDFIESEKPDCLIKRLGLSAGIRGMKGAAATLVREAPCQEVVLEGDDVNLRILPVLKCWPGDGGPFITLPLVFTGDPETGTRNAGMYRMQVYDEKTTGMHWYAGTGGAGHYRKAEKRNEPLEAAVVLGPDPAMTYAATAPLPKGVDEVLFAGFLGDAPVEMVKCRTVDLEVPASAQVVLEGHVEPGERRIEGPFGNHTGFYSPREEYPVFHITCMTTRKRPVYPATIAGPPPQEDCYMAKATERLFLPLIKKSLPEISDINLPVEGIFNNLAFVSINKRYPGQARKVMQGLWGLGRMMFFRIICIFDREVDVQDAGQVLWHLGNNVEPRRDICFIDGPVDSLNWTSPITGYGSRMGIDCTKKLKEECFDCRRRPEVMEMDAEVRAKVDALWPALGLSAK